MTVSTNTQPKRYWKIGSAMIEDQFYMLPFKQAFELLAKHRPQVRHVQMWESDGVPQPDGSVVYTIPVIPPKTNG